MRALIWGVVLACLACIAWWGLAAFGLHQGLTTWIEDRRQDGWQAEMSDIEMSGFPSTVSARISMLDIADPETGVAVSLPNLTMSFRTLWPGDMRLQLPDQQMTFAAPDGRIHVLAQEAVADLNLHPGPDLELENLSLTSGPFLFDDNANISLFAGTDATLALRQADDVPNRYQLRFEVTEFAPGTKARAALRLPDDWPLIFDDLIATARVTFDTPIDRRALDDRRPQPQLIDIQRVEARWGDLRLLSTGTLNRDAQGLADGTLTLKAENWQKILDLAETSGLVPSQFRPQIEGALRGLASGTGSTNDLDVTLTFSGGLTRLGFIPLGPAPSMVLR
ncbi:MAG: DUF2125 domain-containing protein [Paracoccaceae bacterium]